MNKQVNEFSVDVTSSSSTMDVPPLSPPIDYVRDNGYNSSSASVMSPAGMGDDSSIAIGDVAEIDPFQDPRNITVYAGNITPVSFSTSDEISSFDIVFSIGVVNNGESKTYQVVKRVGVDKCKIAAQAAAGTPVSIVETKEPPKTKPAFSEIQRMRRIAGLD